MNQLQAFIAAHPMGFIKEGKDTQDLIAIDRLCPVIVRLGGGRLTCPVQDLAHLLECVKAGGDYVRDVSITPDAIANAGGWHPMLATPRNILDHPGEHGMVWEPDSHS